MIPFELALGAGAWTGSAPEAAVGAKAVPARTASVMGSLMHEGTLRSYMRAQNGREDYAVYAITRGDWRGDGR